LPDRLFAAVTCRRRAKSIIELIATVDDAAAADPTEVERAWAAELELRIARADANRTKVSTFPALDYRHVRALIQPSKSRPSRS